MIFVCKIPVKTIWYKFFFIQWNFFCHKKNERFKTNRMLLFSNKKGVASLPLIGQNKGAQHTRILAFSRPWNETGLAEMEGFSVHFFFFPRSLLFFPTFHFFISISAVCQSSRRAYARPTTFSPWTSTPLLLSVMCDWVRKPAFLRRFKL